MFALIALYLAIPMLRPGHVLLLDHAVTLQGNEHVDLWGRSTSLEADLPLDIVLDDGDSPMPTAKLSSLQEVEVLARISATGSANRGPGDLESRPVRVRLPATAPVALDIAP